MSTTSIADMEAEMCRLQNENDEFRAELAALKAQAAQPLTDAECAKYLKDGETPAQRIEREMRDTDAVLTLLIREKGRTRDLEDLLRSAHCIAQRQGADTAWDTFAACIKALGIGAVTARVFKVSRDHGIGKEGGAA